MPPDPSLEGMSKEQRRKLALKKLARVFGKGGGGGGGGGNRDAQAERSILQEILRKTDQKEIADLVQGRLTVLTCDESSSSESSDSDSDEDENEEERAPKKAAVAPAPPQPAKGPSLGQALRGLVHGEVQAHGQVMDPAYWEGVVGGALTAAGGAAGLPPAGSSLAWDDPEQPRALHGDLAGEGYCVSEAFGQDEWARAGVDMAALSGAIAALRRAGWPPVFIFMYDAAWKMVGGLLELVAPLLRSTEGGGAVLEPSFFSWALEAAGGGGAPGGGPKVGNNFGLPHRDYSHDESWDMRGPGDPVPEMLCVWVPVTEAALDNGCLYVLPRPFDPLWDRPDHPGHTRAAMEVGEGGGAGGKVTEVRFPIGGARPLPARAGSVVAWHGNTVHWGAACHPRARDRPRRNLAFTFRRAEGGQFGCSHLPPVRPEEVGELDLARRLQLVAQSILLYSRWYPLDADIVPNCFFQSLHGTP